MVLVLKGALSEGFTRLPILWYDVSVLPQADVDANPSLALLTRQGLVGRA